MAQGQIDPAWSQCEEDADCVSIANACRDGWLYVHQAHREDAEQVLARQRERMGVCAKKEAEVQYVPMCLDAVCRAGY